jgi:ATP-dependent helicase YprA (DUF1998 family)
MGELHNLPNQFFRALRKAANVVSGRREQLSLSIYVAFDGPLDQYYMRSPNELFSRKVEVPRVNTENLVVLEQHVACAAAELPLVPSIDTHYFGWVCLQTLSHFDA